uniref:LRRCT domain-containing protein n=1 Tax=Branchiostoma floridae TaxID=7739 RepID=C3YQ74_BRAFL|eukprot:XP_002601566.1 hypothetical protein BRAFLDRAFT_110432 [Branchiostoma floridae]
MGSATALFMLTSLIITTGRTVHYTGLNLTHVPIDSIKSDAYTVKLSHNRISHLGSFKTTPYIRYLFIDNNRVNDLSPQTFQGLCKLRVLDLDRNDIVSLRDFIFSDLAALSDLFLSNNLISAVSKRAFHGLASLEFLELSANRLSVFPMQAIRLIPSKELLLVLLMVNKIRQIPNDIKSAHPNASYQLQGNPLRCPDVEQLSRDYVITDQHMDVWPRIPAYTIDTKHNRSFIARTSFIKSRHKHFGVCPHTFFVSEHGSIRLPLVSGVKRHVQPYFWNTPTGRHKVEFLTEAFVVKDFTEEDSGIYTSELKRYGSTKTYHFDLLLCLNRRPNEKKEHKSVNSQSGTNNTDICAGSTNQSCCSNWLTLSSFDQMFCTVGNINLQAKPIVLSITVTALSAILITLFLTTLICWRKQRTNRPREKNSTTSATLHVGVQAMVVCIPFHTLRELTEYSTEGESDLNAFPLRPLREIHWSRMKMGDTNYSLHCVLEALPADTVGTTEVQVHHYDNDDVPGAVEDGQDHQYASAAPPPLPVYRENTTHAVNPDVLAGVTENSALQIGKDEMPYGVAAANTLYQRDMALNNSCLTTVQASSSTTNYCPTKVKKLYAIAKENTQDTSPTGSEHTRNTTANCCANEKETVTTDHDLYRQQP